MKLNDYLGQVSIDRLRRLYFAPGLRVEYDVAKMITYIDGETVTDEEMHRHMTKHSDPTKSQTDARTRVTEELHGVLAELDEVKKLEVQHESRGPLGGLSSQLAAWIELDGELHPVLVNVYCDDRVKDKLVADAEAKVAESEERARIRKLVLGEEES